MWHLSLLESNLTILLFCSILFGLPGVICVWCACAHSVEVVLLLKDKYLKLLIAFFGGMGDACAHGLGGCISQVMEPLLLIIELSSGFINESQEDIDAVSCSRCCGMQGAEMLGGHFAPTSRIQQ